MRVERKRTERRSGESGWDGELDWLAVAESRVNRKRCHRPIGNSDGDTRTHMGTQHWRRGGSFILALVEQNTAPGAGSSFCFRAISG